MKILLFTLAVLVAAGSAAALWVEARALRAAGQWESRIFLSADSTGLSLPLAWSIHAQRVQLARCDDLLHAMQLQLFSLSAQNGLAQACRGFAQTVLRARPGDGAAYLVLAAADQRLSGDVRAADYLERARIAAPNEGWLAARRVRFAAAAQSGVLVAPDVRLLAQSDAMRVRLAQIYDRYPQYRAQIVEDLQASPDGDRAGFLSAVRHLSREPATW